MLNKSWRLVICHHCLDNDSGNIAPTMQTWLCYELTVFSSSGTENPAFPQFSTCTSSSTGEWTFSVLSILWFCLCCDVVCLHLDMHVHVNNFWCYGKQVWFRWYTIQIWDNIYLWCERAHLYLLYLYREPVRVRLKLQQRLHQKRISRSWRPDIWTLR